MSMFKFFMWINGSRNAFAFVPGKGNIPLDNKHFTGTILRDYVLFLLLFWFICIN